MSKNQHSRNNFAPKVVPPTPPYDATDKHRHRSSGGPRPYVRDRDARGAMPARPIQLMFGVMVAASYGFMTYALLRSGAGIETVLVVLAVLGVATLVIGNNMVRARRAVLRAGKHYTTEIADNVDRAVKRAGYDLADAPLLLDDVGIVAYKDSTDPRIVRTDMPSDTTHIRPFVVLTPRSRNEAGRTVITFRLLDEHGTVRYTSQAGYMLQHRQNFLTPNTWLRLSGEPTPSEKWALHISLNDQTPLAIHRFGWHKPVDV